MIYQLSIRLDNVEPEVSRVVVVEDDMTLFELHLVVQIAMGWENCASPAVRVPMRRQVGAAQLIQLEQPESLA